MNRYGYKGRHLFLKRARREESQTQFATLLRTSQATVSRWENQWKERYLDEVVADRFHVISSIPDKLQLVLYSRVPFAIDLRLFALIQRVMREARRFANMSVRGWRVREHPVPPLLPPGRLPSDDASTASNPSALTIHQPVFQVPALFISPGPAEPTDDDAEDEDEQETAPASEPEVPLPASSRNAPLLSRRDITLLAICFVMLAACLMPVTVILYTRTLPPVTAPARTAPPSPPEEARPAQPDGGMLEIPGWNTPDGADGGTPVLPPSLPFQRFKGQKPPPCDAVLHEVESIGVCWLKLEGAPPCSPLSAEHDDMCLIPVPARKPPPPNANTPSP